MNNLLKTALLPYGYIIKGNTIYCLNGSAIKVEEDSDGVKLITEESSPWAIRQILSILSNHPGFSIEITEDSDYIIRQKPEYGEILNSITRLLRKGEKQ